MTRMKRRRRRKKHHLEGERNIETDSENETR
jgi:hypothetical protein